MSFFRVTLAEAESRPGLKQMAVLEGIPLYLHPTLAGYFEAQPLVLTARGPRLAIEKDGGLVEFEAALRRDFGSGHDGR